MRLNAANQNTSKPSAHWRRTCGWRLLTTLTMMTVVTGCQHPPDDPAIDVPPTMEVEPNENFAAASPVNFDQRGRALIQAEIAPFKTVIDADFFALGSVQAGDRLIVEANPSDGVLDPVIAVLYPDGTIFAMNDDKDAQMDELGAMIDQVFPQDAEAVYLALAPAKGTVLMGGTYDVLITLERGGPPPQPQFQTVVLDFDGGTTTLRNGNVVDVGPFDAADIDPKYAGQSLAAKAAIVETCLQNFSRFNIQVLNTEEHDLPTDRPYSTVLFGGSDPSGFGIAAEGIDLYNRNPSDTAVVFTESFTPNRFTLSLDAFSLGVAIGNVASHEVGHLLGLQHVLSFDDLMSPFDAPDLLLSDQRFRSSFLHPSLSLVFFYLPVSPPIFIQNENRLLEQTLGRVNPATSFSLATGEAPNDVTAADVSGDEVVDLIVANTFSNTVSVYLNDGVGMFSDPTDYSIIGGPIALSAVDLDKDGDLDLAVANLGSSDVEILLNDGDGQFTDLGFLPVGMGPISIVSGDFDNDGNVDVATANFGDASEEATNTGDVSVNYGDGTGMFSFILTAAAGHRPIDITAADLNEDGFLDLAVANFPVDEFGFGGISLLFNDGTGLFDPPVELRANQLPVSITAADLSGDGVPDLVVGNKFSGDVSVLINNGNETFSDPFSSPAGDMIESVITADIDADGDLDVAAVGLESRSVSVLLNLGDGILGPELFFALEDAPRSIAAGDVNHDGRLDLVAASEERNTISVLLNNGIGASRTSILTGKNLVSSAPSRLMKSIHAGKVNADAPSLCLTCRDEAIPRQPLLTSTDVRNIFNREAK